MTRDLSAPAAPAGSVAYAESLYGYAAPRLDPFSLRCWIIERLMLDDGIEHRCAEEIFEYVLSKQLACAGEARRTSRRHRPHRPLTTARRAH